MKRVKQVKYASKRKSLDFRLTSVAQKRLCLSSLLSHHCNIILLNILVGSRIAVASQERAMERDHLFQENKGYFGIKLENKELQETLTKQFREHGTKSVIYKGSMEHAIPQFSEEVLWPRALLCCYGIKWLHLETPRKWSEEVTWLFLTCFGSRPRFYQNRKFFCSVYSTVYQITQNETTRNWFSATVKVSFPRKFSP